jgi:hypothetical protein
LKRESKYNLPDEDEDEINVHNLLSEKDDFDEDVPFDDESDEEGTLMLLLSLVLEYNPPHFILPFYPVHSAIFVFVYVYLHYMWYGHKFSVLYLASLCIKL